MIKVLYVLDTLNVGGAEKSMLEILRRFKNTHPVMCHLFASSPLKPAFEQAGIRVVSLNIRSRHAYAQAISKLKITISTEQPDLIFLTGFYAGFLGRICGKWQKIPIIDAFTNETYTKAHYDSVPSAYRIKLKIARILEMITLKWVSCIIANSYAVRDKNSKILAVSLKKISVIYRGRNPKLFRPLSLWEKKAIRKKLSLDSDAPIILNVSRLILRKGLSELIQAMDIVKKKIPKVQLLIAGEGHFRTQLEELIQIKNLQDTVHLLGKRDDIPTLLQAADIFAFPSHFEGQPGALVEAMFTALPVVASDIPVHQEMIAERKIGVLVPLGRHDIMAEEMINLINDRSRAQIMGDSARQAALEHFDIEKIATEHETIYESIIQNLYGKLEK